MVLPYFEGKVPAGFPSPAEDYLETAARPDGIPDREKSRDLHDAGRWRLDERRRHPGRRSAGRGPGIKPVNGSVVVVAVNGEYTVKRLRRGPDCVWLDPANPRYQPHPCLTGGRAACLRRCQARDPHDAMSHGRGLRAHRLQQLLRLLRARLPARSRRRSRHRALEQRWLRRRKVVGGPALSG